MPKPQPTKPLLGVIIVSYTSGDVLPDCLESLLATTGVQLRIVVVDNASPDRTLEDLVDWATGRVPYSPPPDLPFALSTASKPVRIFDPQDAAPAAGHSLTLIRNGVNGGFAAGVNLGLAHLARDAAIDRFWVLNPDCMVPPTTPTALAAAPTGFSLLGNRVIYLDHPDIIQIDGGTLNRLTAVTGNINLGQPATAPAPDPARFDFICGASMVASRAFYEATGPMQEDYFLYYEEVDWALRRGALPLAFCAGAPVYHRAGTAIGSPALGRMASAFSLYFKHRARLRFTRRFLPWSLSIAWAFGWAKAAQVALKGHPAGALALLCGQHGLTPPAEVARRLTPSPRPGALPPDPRDI